jgi:O-antigen ligase
MKSNESFSGTGRNRVPATVAMIQALLLVIFLSWRFGGMESLAREIAGWLCLPGPVITWFAWRQADRTLRRHFWRIIWPLLVLTVLVLVSLFNPNMRVLLADGRPSGLIGREPIWFLPSTALPANTAGDFFLNAGLILVGLNLFISNPGRAQQRLLLGVIAANATILACVGSVFKLGHATAILGQFPSPNPRFFATFFYYNHWGAFALLAAAAAAGLALHHARQAPAGQWQHTPAPLFGVFTILLLVSLPLGGGRGSVAAGLILSLVLAARVVFGSGRPREHRGPRLAVAVVVMIGFAAATLWLARDSLRTLLDKTSTQVATMRSGGIGEVRLPLYRDIWKLIEARPVYGWGWHSFRYAFRPVQSFDARMENEQKEPSVFLDAHSDWLQLLVELGLAGAALAATALAGVASVASRNWWRLSPTFEIVAGLVCLGLLAAVDFPFACPAVVVTAWVLLMSGAAIALDRSRRAT